MKSILFFTFSLAIFSSLFAQTYAIKAEYLIDGISDKAYSSPTIIVHKNKIIDVNFLNHVPDSANVLELKGYTILPGLIDAHTHLLTKGGDFSQYEKDLYRYSEVYRSLRAVSHLKTALNNGFTTLRDVCTEGAGYADVDLANAISKGYIDGPRIYPSTRGIAITGNYMIPPIVQNWGLNLPSGAQLVSGKEECIKAVREQIAHGAKWIKVFVDWWHVSFSIEELKAIVQEAAKYNVKVAAHATLREGIEMSINAGVGSIEHGDGFTEELMKKAIEKNIYLCPTITTYEYHKTEENENEKQFRMLRKAYKMGLKVVIGTDAGSYPWEVNQAKEFEYYVKNANFKTIDAIKSGTSLAAELLGREDDLGQLKKGFIANIIAVKGNPLNDITLLQSVDFVMKNGKIYKNNVN